MAIIASNGWKTGWPAKPRKAESQFGTDGDASEKKFVEIGWNCVFAAKIGALWACWGRILIGETATRATRLRPLFPRFSRPALAEHLCLAAP